ncbi:tetratricopeptide repeat protein [Streptomyces sp. NPDC048282]|uniref:tetratricopeptide repeat protein n=1 Tax=Streptomyces sp. NPDC048282 TaxID=3365528 RepID=UPI003721A868
MEQSATASDFAQIIQAGRDLTVYGSRAPYHLETWPLPVRPISTGQAQVQPSRLLQVRYEVIEFVGRERELSALHSWREESDRPLSVRLVHGPGGQGKTRLATQMARSWKRDGWTVLNAHVGRSRPGPVGAESACLGGAAGILVIVDYAQEWEAEHLLALLNDLSASVQIPVRILLLARSVGTWWQSLSHRMSKQLDITPDVLPLVPLGCEPSDRETLFADAARQFADFLGVAEPPTFQPPSAIHVHAAYALVLTVHMAALAVVLAYTRNAAAPVDPGELSAYLLDREREHWSVLHERGVVKADPDTMVQIVTVAALVGPLPYAEGQTALAHAGIESREHEGRLLKDHAVCYPACQDVHATMLEPLYPDRLSEDFLALTIPGHDYPYPVDPWVVDATERLLTPGDCPPWTRTALTKLTEVAQRWPHVAQSQLFPLLRKHPELAVQAGNQALIGFAGLEDLAPELLADVCRVLSEHLSVDLAVGYAAVMSRLRRAAQLAPDAASAHVHTIVSQALQRAGQYEDALAEGRSAVTIYRKLNAVDPHTCDAEMAAVLTSVSECLSRSGQRVSALNAAEESVFLYRGLTSGDSETFEPCLAVALNNLADCLVVFLHRPAAALAPADEAVRIARRLIARNPSGHKGELALALATCSKVLAALGSVEDATAAAEESLEIRRCLADANEPVHASELANALSTYGSTLWRVGQYDDALRYFEESIVIFRRLAEVNPDRFLPVLVGRLTDLADGYRKLELRSKVVTVSEELVELVGRQSLQSPGGPQSRLAIVTYHLGLAQAQVGQWEDAFSSVDKAIDLLRPWAKLNLKPFEVALIRFLCGAAIIRLEGRTRIGEVGHLVNEALRSYAGLVGYLPESLRDDIRDAFDALVKVLEAGGDFKSAEHLQRYIFECKPNI